MVGGALIVRVVNRADLEPALYPIVVLALALAAFAVAGMIGGSGFLAVYVAGLIAGNSRMRHAAGAEALPERHDLAQPDRHVPDPRAARDALAIRLGRGRRRSDWLLFLTFLARPIAVWALPAAVPASAGGRSPSSPGSGLRGAVSILLAILPVIAGLDHGQEIFNIAFIIVLASLLVQGWTIGPMARFLGLVVPARHGPVDRIELELPGRGNHEIVAYAVHPESAVAKGQRIPRWARPSLLIRDGRSLRPHRAGRPQAGDRVYVITTPDYVGLLDRSSPGRPIRRTTRASTANSPSPPRPS